ncbi:MAG TPA: SGNH/GDSL hydrolase family protein [Pedobacter sp.]|jgi:hypothetical protein
MKRIGIITGFLLLITFTQNIHAQLRIVCIGNSISQGKNEKKADSTFEYSYRPWLWEKLTLDGFNVDMVGYHPFFFLETKGNLTMNFRNKTGKPFDRDCEAYYGITSDVFLTGTQSTIWTGEPLPPFRERINDPIKGYTPDVALIHIGTNDADSTEALVADSRKNIISIISILREKNPNAQIFLATLITGWKKINGKIDGICNELSNPTSPVIPVDMTTGFINSIKSKGTMTFDHVHPNINGQLFMMERWHSALLTHLKDRQKPVLNGKASVSKSGRTSIELQWHPANDNYGIKQYEIRSNKKLIKTLSHQTTSYKINTLKPRSFYNLQLVARDFSGNVSSPISIRVNTK